jgi:hypothetical protein
VFGLGGTFFVLVVLEALERNGQMMNDFIAFVVIGSLLAITLWFNRHDW